MCNNLSVNMKSWYSIEVFLYSRQLRKLIQTTKHNAIGLAYQGEYQGTDIVFRFIIEYIVA
jgi:hypothetical protein